MSGRDGDRLARSTSYHSTPPESLHPVRVNAITRVVEEASRIRPWTDFANFFISRFPLLLTNAPHSQFLRLRALRKRRTMYLLLFAPRGRT